jgi:hypothetical protein
MTVNNRMRSQCILNDSVSQSRSSGAYIFEYENRVFSVYATSFDISVFEGGVSLGNTIIENALAPHTVIDRHLLPLLQMSEVLEDHTLSVIDWGNYFINEPL